MWSGDSSPISFFLQAADIRSILCSSGCAVQNSASPVLNLEKLCVYPVMAYSAYTRVCSQCSIQLEDRSVIWPSIKTPASN